VPATVAPTIGIGALSGKAILARACVRPPTTHVVGAELSSPGLSWLGEWALFAPDLSEGCAERSRASPDDLAEPKG